MRTTLVISMIAVLTSCSERSPDATGSDGAKATAAQPRFLSVDGTVSIDGAKAAAGTPIGEKATIEVAKGSQAVVTLQPGSAFEIREGTRLNVGSSSRRKTSVQLLSGVLWSILPSGEADFEVVTGNAVAGVRGTTMFIDTNTEGATIVCVCQGEVELAAGTHGPENVASDHRHWAYRITGSHDSARSELMGQAEDAPNHPNARREELRSLVE